MKWVTRARPKTDRPACPWRVTRFIDTKGEFLCVAPADAMREGLYAWYQSAGNERHGWNPEMLNKEAHS